MLYCILDIDELNNVPYKHYRENGMEVIQDSADTVQTNLDNTEFTIAFVEDNPPSVVEGKTIYTRKELDNIINDPSNGWIN
tara:strand:+ start:514 stop:756 length:243 start_codon:yes stop_codon:yes gene_type:complete